MTLPLFDPIDLPPGTILVDVNSLPDGKREECQGLALQLWMDETGEGPDEFAAREWDDNEGIFVVTEDGTLDTIIGLVVVTDVEAL